MGSFTRVAIALPALLLLGGCAASRESRAQSVARDYFDVYAERMDFEKLMSFFADNAELVDMVYGHRADGAAEIAAFLDWSRGSFRVVDGKQALVVDRQVAQGNQVVTHGVFRTFEFNGETLGPWAFTIWLTFSPEGKILREEDWINYTPRENYLGGVNMNPPRRPPVKSTDF